MRTTSGLLLCAFLLAFLPYCLANIKKLISDDFSETPEIASFSAVRLRLGQPKKPNLRSTVRMRSDFTDTFGLRKALVVIFEKISVPSYGDFCPNVILSLGKDTDPPESFLDIDGGYLPDDLEKEWYKEDANQVTL
ncbi:unnamed protein product [Dibothriocephalus latus]|uniref:Uncharacterized protein n=1 Tax=Dibothriocephalus latus TaxID=60516 RepID=A0A3P6QSN0_DIBLA|nr:unnamed protein product [Dibothriocephalus latus]